MKRPVEFNWLKRGRSIDNIGPDYKSIRATVMGVILDRGKATTIEITEELRGKVAVEPVRRVVRWLAEEKQIYRENRSLPWKPTGHGRPDGGMGPLV